MNEKIDTLVEIIKCFMNIGQIEANLLKILIAENNDTIIANKHYKQQLASKLNLSFTSIHIAFSRLKAANILIREKRATYTFNKQIVDINRLKTAKTLIAQTSITDQNLSISYK